MRKRQTEKTAWKRRAEARPDEILDAALDEFVKMGFEAARIEDIARKAGLSKGAVYLYFSSKQALLKALIEREIAPLVSEQLSLAAGATGEVEDVLRAMLLRLAAILASPRIFAIPRIVISIAGRFPEIRDQYVNSVAGPARAGMEALIRRGIEMGTIRPVDPAAAVRTLIGPILFEAMWAHVLGGKSAFDDPEQFVRGQIDLLLHGLKGKPSS